MRSCSSNNSNVRNSCPFWQIEKLYWHEDSWQTLAQWLPDLDQMLFLVKRVKENEQSPSTALLWRGYILD